MENGIIHANRLSPGHWFYSENVTKYFCLVTLLGMRIGYDPMFDVYSEMSCLVKSRKIHLNRLWPEILGSTGQAN